MSASGSTGWMTSSCTPSTAVSSPPSPRVSNGGWHSACPSTTATSTSRLGRTRSPAPFCDTLSRHECEEPVPFGNQLDRRVRPAGVLDSGSDHRRRLVRFPGRTGPVPPLRVAGLPLGAPRDHRPPAAWPRAGRVDVGRRSDSRRARLGVPRRRRARSRSGVRLQVPVGGVPADRPDVHRSLHRAVHLGSRHRPARHQQLSRHHDRLRDRSSRHITGGARRACTPGTCAPTSTR